MLSHDETMRFVGVSGEKAREEIASAGCVGSSVSVAGCRVS